MCLSLSQGFLTVSCLLSYQSPWMRLLVPGHSRPGVNPVPVPELFSPVVKGPIRARSADGLEMLISISFQWRLKPRAEQLRVGYLWEIKRGYSCSPD